MNQKCFICVFWRPYLKNHCHIWNEHHQIWLIPNIGAKIKMPDLRVLGLKFENTFVLFEISMIEFVLLQSLVKSKNPQTWDQKYLLWVFLDWKLKMILSYLNLCNFNTLWNMEMPKFGAKNALVEYFWARISKNHIWNQHP